MCPYFFLKTNIGYKVLKTALLNKYWLDFGLLENPITPERSTLSCKAHISHWNPSHVFKRISRRHVLQFSRIDWSTKNYLCLLDIKHIFRHDFPHQATKLNFETISNLINPYFPSWWLMPENQLYCWNKLLSKTVRGKWSFAISFSIHLIRFHSPVNTPELPLFRFFVTPIFFYILFQKFHFTTNKAVEDPFPQKTQTRIIFTWWKLIGKSAKSGTPIVVRNFFHAKKEPNARAYITHSGKSPSCFQTNLISIHNGCLRVW